MKKSRDKSVATNAASMADIAFLLLIFFMVTTSIVNDKGLDLVLPPLLEDVNTTNINERNLFKILINSENKLLVENETREDYKHLKADIMAFVLNKGKASNLSDTPKDAIVSIKANRGTTQDMYLHVLDQAKAAYYQIYADLLQVKPKAIRDNKLSLDQAVAYKKIRTEIPMNISIAEPD
ncbi:ExbD/TolR family protein [Fulvivirga lutimaris]|uniref:ExbD/TolR family protein n=1 Tax=Fulvivirga lutimaris TaxID=1819566 RepID=UPI0012BB58BE|nr:biopolymer transporter ExbD [Fulvivirga lutimaris]MTI38380.1 biopolymer transporter ExbD [Fulvivirga lutimaris]